MRYLLLFGWMCCGLASWAQNHLVVRTVGDTLVGNQLTWHNPVMDAPYALLDSVRIEVADVAYFGNGWFWFQKDGSTNELQFLRRTMQCSLDLYTEVDSDEVLSYPNIQVGGVIRANEAALPFSHYEHPNGTLYAANYTNLKRDAGMFPVSKMALKEYKWMRIAQYTVAAAGVGLTSYAASKNEFTPIMVLGISMTAGSLLFERPKRERIWQAATYYGVEAEPVD